MNTSNKLAIDFLINKMSGGGAERVVSILANYFSDKGYTIRIITFTGDDNYSIVEKIKRIKLHNHPLFHSVVFNGFFSLLHFYKRKENRPDIISSHINLLGYSTIPIAKIYGIKIIVSEHNNHFTKSTFAKRILWDYLYRFADAVTILTDFDKPYFEKRNKNVCLMPNPSTFEKINNNNSINTINNKEILAIGALDRYDHKGFDNLIKIAAQVLKKHSDWNFKIVGAGSDGLNYLKELAIKHEVENKIIFTGFRQDIKELIRECSIYILSSRYEGLPMTLLEAMSQGACCIAYDCISGPSDIITNGVNGILVENQNMNSMIDGLNSLIENPDLRKKLKTNAPNAIDKFSIQNVGTRWEILFKKII